MYISTVLKSASPVPEHPLKKCLVLAQVSLGEPEHKKVE